MRKSILTMVCTALLLACSDKDGEQGAAQLQSQLKTYCENMDSLYARLQADMGIGETDDWSLTTGVYEGQRVFMVASCCVACNSVIPIYNCEGAHVGTLDTTGTQTDGDWIQSSDITDQEKICACGNCNFSE